MNPLHIYGKNDVIPYTELEKEVERQDNLLAATLPERELGHVRYLYNLYMIINKNTKSKRYNALFPYLYDKELFGINIAVVKAVNRAGFFIDHSCSCDHFHYCWDKAREIVEILLSAKLPRLGAKSHAKVLPADLLRTLYDFLADDDRATRAQIIRDLTPPDE
jgi:hypothetical protein